jgi:hypothetical protein
MGAKGRLTFGSACRRIAPMTKESIHQMKGTTMKTPALLLTGTVLCILAIGGCTSPKPKAIDTSSLVDTGVQDAVKTLEAMNADLKVTTQPDIDLKGPSAQHWFVKAVEPKTEILPGGDVTLTLASSFDRAVRYCGVGDVKDNGATLLIDMAGNKAGSGKLTYANEKCLLEHLKAPTSVTEKMNATRALDGRRDAQWDGITAEWSYHPDNGLDVILTLDN